LLLPLLCSYPSREIAEKRQDESEGMLGDGLAKGTLKIEKRQESLILSATGAISTIALPRLTFALVHTILA